MKHSYKVWWLSGILMLAGCTAKDLEQDPSTAVLGTVNPNGAAKQLSKAEYTQLTPEQQYQVVNKALGAMFKGLPAREFFDLSAGTNTLRVKDDKKNYLEYVAYKITQREQNPETYFDYVKTAHTFSDERRAMAEPLAIIHELPLSRDAFDRWMAYVLANTILFSPAGEIDSTTVEVDVKILYENLVKWISDDISIRDIVYSHEVSVQNWRRFRSPEDNTREMIEIYLGLFDRDADVPKASQACKNWYLTDDTQGYQLVVDRTNANKEPVVVLDRTIVSCEDFFTIVAQHPLVIPRITNVLVDHFFPDSPVETRAALVASIVDLQPKRFNDIFAAIIFSKEYLLSNSRPKSFEEAFLNLAQRTEWTPSAGYFNNLMTSSKSGDNINGNGGKNLENMKQPNMLLKLGRWKDQPLDSYSFSVYHKAIRDDLMTLSRASETGSGWGPELVAGGKILNTESYVDYLFLTATGRKATADEKLLFAGSKADPNNPVAGLFDTLKITTDRRAQANVVFDYISRLAEIYFVNAIQ